MTPFTIHWSYNFPFYPGIPQIGTTLIKAESKEKALETFRNIGYPGVSFGEKGYYRVEKIEPGSLVNYKV
jgi:hypothetical protein